MNRNRNIILSVKNASVDYDDRSLVEKFEKAKKDILQKKQAFNSSLSNLNENDYLSFAVAKFAYEFAKEEYDVLESEVIKRGLMSQR